MTAAETRSTESRPGWAARLRALNLPGHLPLGCDACGASRYRYCSASSPTLIRIGLLAVDVSRFGVVMSADSQPIELLDHETRVLASTGRQLRRCPILIREGGGFVGFTGFVGTEAIGSSTTRDWLADFGEQHPNLGLAGYAEALGDALSDAWRELGLVSILEILVSGVENGEVRFWFVRNSNGLHDGNWTYRPPQPRFVAVDDLDGNYMPHDLQPGQSKEDLLRSRIYSFRQGVLLPAAQVFEAFGTILQTIYAQPVEGFKPVDSLDDLAYFARQRIEFLKRLYSGKHGIYRRSPAPLGGQVHVLGVSSTGEVRQFPKIRKQAKTLRSPG
jgi:hypothetical protein